MCVYIHRQCQSLECMLRPYITTDFIVSVASKHNRIFLCIQGKDFQMRKYVRLY